MSITTEVTPAIIGFMLSPVSRRLPAYIWVATKKGRPKSIIDKYSLARFMVSVESTSALSPLRYSPIRGSAARLKISSPQTRQNKPIQCFMRTVF